MQWLKRNNLNIKHSGRDTSISKINRTKEITNIRLIMDIILKSCFLCRFRTKSYLTTNEGSLHESYFTSTAPFMVVYMDLALPHNFANYLHQQDLKGLTANKAHVLVVVCSITRCARLAICGGTDTASVTLALNSIMLRTPAIVKIITDRQSSFTKMAREAKYVQCYEHDNRPFSGLICANRSIPWYQQLHSRDSQW